MMQTESSLDRTVRSWASQKPNYTDPHFASVNTTLSPSSVDVDLVGHFVSGVFERGVWTFMFSGQKNRDRFVNKYRQHGAKPCKDPLP